MRVESYLTVLNVNGSVFLTLLYYDNTQRDFMLMVLNVTYASHA